MKGWFHMTEIVRCLYRKFSLKMQWMNSRWSQNAGNIIWPHFMQSISIKSYSKYAFITGHFVSYSRYSVYKVRIHIPWNLWYCPPVTLYKTYPSPFSLLLTSPWIMMLTRMTKTTKIYDGHQKCSQKWEMAVHGNIYSVKYCVHVHVHKWFKLKFTNTKSCEKLWDGSATEHSFRILGWTCCHRPLSTDLHSQLRKLTGRFGFYNRLSLQHMCSGLTTCFSYVSSFSWKTYF